MTRLVGLIALLPLAVFALVIACPGLSAAAERALGTGSRYALIIGNSHYAIGPLRNPVNDARALAQVLRALAWNVDLVENASYPVMDKAIRAFGDSLREGYVGLFYYAGHGVQVGGRNFLIPVDSVIEREDEIPFKAIDVGQVLAKLESAGNAMNIVILDACRNNPFARSTRSAVAGLAHMDAPVGSIIAYATAPGAEARDGLGSNGVYTKHLLANISVPGLKVEDVFKRVRAAVRQETQGEQVPWENTSLEGDFYFVPAEAASVDTPSVAMAQPPSPTLSPAATENTWTATARPRMSSDVQMARCWGIVHRASLGEPLNTEDEEFLRSECRRTR
jgi:uncharacterized caspase-like protein